MMETQRKTTIKQSKREAEYRIDIHFKTNSTLISKHRGKRKGTQQLSLQLKRCYPL